MRLPKELIPIVLILAMLIGINVFRERNVPARHPQTVHAKYVSYSAEKQGTKAFYLLLEKLGYKPKRLRTPHLTGLRTSGLAIILVPDRPPINETDVERLLEWLQQGNTLVFAPSEGDQLAESLGIKLHKGNPLEASIAPFAYTNLTAGIQRLTVRSGDRMSTERSDVVRHFGDSAGGVVISLREEAGTVVALSDPYLVTNAGLEEGGNLDLLVNILLSYATDTKTVYFDEYHHGFERRPTVLHLFRSATLGWALLQVATAVLLLMYSRGRRFGRPKPPRTRGETHRLSVEYVTSLAGIYQTAHASGVALSNLYERLSRSVAQSVGSAGIPVSIKELMDQCERKMQDGKISEKELIDLWRRMELALHPVEPAAGWFYMNELAARSTEESK